MRAYLSSRAGRVAVRARGFALVGGGGLSHRAVAEAERILAETEPNGWDGWDAAFPDGHIGLQTPDHRAALADALAAFLEG